MKKLHPFSRFFIALSALLLIITYFVPMWQILMWAPQYPEGLEMKIWLNNLTGDVKIISALNHYIGMKHIEVSMFPEFSFMVYIVGFVIFVGLLAALINNRAALIAYAAVLGACGIAAMVDFYLWGYNYGHNLDPTAPIVVPGMSYQPPLIGTKQLLNFTAFSGPDIGGWIFIGTAVAALAILAWEIYKSKQRASLATPALLAAIGITLASCSAKPEPIVYGKDGCHHCKMTLMDERFGAELVTKKGKVYKFDDVNCMVKFLNEGQVAEADIAHSLVVDYARPGTLISSHTATYVKSEAIKSPMASNVAGFSSAESAETFNRQWQGDQLTWNTVVSESK